MKYKIEDIEYNVIITKKNNKNTYIRVKEDLNIYVTTNYLVTNSQIKKLLDSNYNYLNKMMITQTKKKEKKEQFYYMGKPYDIILMPNKEPEFIDNRIYVKDDKSLNKWLKKNMIELYQNELDRIYHRFEEKIPYPKLKIRCMKTRWGVCNKRDNSVTLNSDLMKYDIDKLDYVIVHELSHFIHFNHSTSFWLLVSKYCPNYKKIRKDLKE